MKKGQGVLNLFLPPYGEVENDADEEEASGDVEDGVHGSFRGVEFADPRWRQGDDFRVGGEAIHRVGVGDGVEDAVRGFPHGPGKCGMALFVIVPRTDDAGAIGDVVPIIDATDVVHVGAGPPVADGDAAASPLAMEDGVEETMVAGPKHAKAVKAGHDAFGAAVFNDNLIGF